MKHSKVNQFRTEHKTCASLFRVANFLFKSLNLESSELLPSKMIRNFISVLVTSILALNFGQANALECNGQYVIPITFSNWGVAPQIGGDFQLNPNWTGTYGSYKWLQWSAASTEEQKRVDFFESVPYPGNLTKYQNPKIPTDTSLNPFDWVRIKSGVTIDDELKLAVSSLVGKRVVIPYKIVSETVNGEEITQIGGFREVEFLDFRFNDYTKRMYLRYWGEVDCDTPPNVAPVANTGNYLVVNEQTTVNLNGSNSTDLDGSITAYNWVQLSGTDVALQNSTSPIPTFTAPAVTSTQTLVFQLTVTDNDGATSKDAVVVTVNPVNIPPNVSQGVTLECNGLNVIPITFKNWSVAPAIGGDFQLNPNWTGTYGKYYWLQWSAASAEEQKRADFIESLPYPGTLAKYQNPNSATDTNLNPFDWARVKSDVPLDGDLRVAVSSLVGKRVVIPYKIVSQTVNGEEITQIGGFREVEFLDFRFNDWTKRMYLRYWGEVNCDTTPNVAPVADAGIDLSVNAQTTVSLNGSNSTDSDGSVAAYYWIQQSGIAVTLQNSTSPTPTFTAPSVSTVQTLVFQLTVTDNKGATSTDTVVVTVNPATNTHPNANAGTDQTVNEGVNVNLNGSASTDSDGNIASYSWAQTSGTSVTLTGETTATPSFTAPTLTASEVLTFELTVTDNEGATATDTIAVTVNPVNAVPVANAGADQTVNEGVSVSLNGAASSDSDGSIASYSWTQTAGTVVTLTGATTAMPSFVAPTLTATEELSFELTVTDNEGATSTDTIHVTVNHIVPPDTVAPTLSLTTSDGQVTESANLLLSGIVSDPVQPYSGIASVVVRSDRYGSTTFNGSLSDGTFSVDLPLQVGLNNLIVIATDVSGNFTERSLSVTRISPPRFENVQPANGSFLNTDRVTIVGEVKTFLPLTDVAFSINDWTITPSGTSETGRYTFNLPNIPLAIGANTFNLNVQTADGLDSQTLTLHYHPADAEALPAPKVEIMAPAHGSVLNSETFMFAGRVISEGGPVTITVNGNPIDKLNESLTVVDFSTLINVPQGQETVVVTVRATDSLGKVSEKSATYYLDALSPVISIDQSVFPVPNLNPVLDNPYVLSGTVTDKNLSAFMVNGKSVSLQPTVVSGVYAFNFSTAIPFGTDLPLNFEAYDSAGNRVRTEYVLRSTAQTGLKIVLPINNLKIESQSEPISVQTVIRTEALNSEDVVFVQVNGGSEQYLTRVSDFISGSFEVPGDAGTYELIFGVKTLSGERVAQTSQILEVIDTQNTPLELVRLEPENGQQLVDINAPIEMHFNRQVELPRLTVSVQETLQGHTYENLDAPGLDFIEAKGHQLVEVNRDRESVSGKLDLLPGGKSAVFYPARTFGFNAEIFVEVSYDDAELERARFKVRPLPTFINGGIVDQFGQPLEGITVTIPELERSTVTNGDGGFAFGYQESAEKLIPGGTYTLVVNPDFKTPRFGTNNKRLNLLSGRRNEVGLIRLQELSPASPFQVITGGSDVSLAGGDLGLDLSNAELIFPDGRELGRVQTQFVPFEHLGVPSHPIAMPMWMFANQPRGIQVNGRIGLTIKMPPLGGTYDYLNEAYTYVMLLGYNPDSGALEPVGVGKIEGTLVTTQTPVAFKSFDFFGYALIDPQHMPALEAVWLGERSLQQLLAELAVTE